MICLHLGVNPLHYEHFLNRQKIAETDKFAQAGPDGIGYLAPKRTSMRRLSSFERMVYWRLVMV